MTPSLLLIGLSHRRAPVDVRERVALSSEQEADLARRLAAQAAARGRVPIDVQPHGDLCGGRGPAGAESAVLDALAAVSGMPADALDRVVYRLHGNDVVLHLFRVASGLDSLVPGEGEILGQVRGAFERGQTGALLGRLFRDAIYTGRRVRSETTIGEVPASVAAAAAALAEQVFGELTSCRVALVGAGKTGELAAECLASRGARIEIVANRSRVKADEVAARHGGRAIALAEVASELPFVDVLVSSTSARGTVLTRAQVEPTLRARNGRPLFLIDIAVPRDLEPAIHDLDGCFLYDIDDLEAVVADSAPDRVGATEAGEAIALAEAERFRTWRAAREVAPAIASLRARAEAIRSAEVERARAKLDHLTDADFTTVEAVTARIVDKLLHVPTVRLKEAAAGADATGSAAALLDLLGLSDDARPGRHTRQ